MIPVKSQKYQLYYTYAYARGQKAFTEYEELASKEEIAFLKGFIRLYFTDEYFKATIPLFIKRLIEMDDFMYYYIQFTNHMNLNVKDINTYNNNSSNFRKYFTGILENNYFAYCMFFMKTAVQTEMVVDVLSSFQCAIAEAHIRKDLKYPYSLTDINMPPRLGKSIICNRVLVTWMLVRDSSLKILEVSETLKLTKEAMKVIKSVFDDKLFQDVFGNKIEWLTNRSDSLVTKKLGQVIQGSVSASMMGQDSDFTIIDDINNMFQSEAAYEKAKLMAFYAMGRKRTRNEQDAIDKMNMQAQYFDKQTDDYDKMIMPQKRKSSGYAPLLIHQRVDIKDVTGLILKEAKKKPDFQMNHFVVPFEDYETKQLVIPRREGLDDIVYDRPYGYIRQLAEEDMMEITSKKGTPYYETVYQQNPESMSEASFQFYYSNFDFYKPIDIEYLFVTTDFAWTTGPSSNYSCICLWGAEFNNVPNDKNANVYLIDVVYDKFNEWELEQLLKTFIQNNIDNIDNNKYVFKRNNIKIKDMFIESNSNQGRIYNMSKWFNEMNYDIAIVEKNRISDISKVERIKETQEYIRMFNIYIRESINEEIFTFSNVKKSQYVAGILEECENYLFAKGKKNTDDFLDNLSDALQAIREYAERDVIISV